MPFTQASLKNDALEEGNSFVGLAFDNLIGIWMVGGMNGGAEAVVVVLTKHGVVMDNGAFARRLEGAERAHSWADFLGKDCQLKYPLRESSAATTENCIL